MALQRLWQGYRHIARDPIYLIALVVAALFVLIAILYPLFAILGQAFSPEGAQVLMGVLRRPVFHRIIINTLVLGLVVATVGTAVGFLLAFV